MLPDELPQFLSKQRKLPGVYIGFLEHPTIPITDDDEEEDSHLDKAQEKRINYIGANDNCKYIVSQFLEVGKGVTYDAFEPVEDPPIPDGVDPDASGYVPPEKEIYRYYPDVTQVPNMHYFKIPKLGAYMTVPLQYKSSLYESSLDAGAIERRRVREAREALAKEKEDAEIEHQQKLDDIRANTPEEELEGALEQAEEEWAQKKEEFKDEEEAEFQSEVKKYVVCVDTLGEDREISEDDRKYVESIVKHFVDCWEQSENNQLSEDIDNLIKLQDEVNKEEFLENLKNRAEDEVNDRQKQDTEKMQEAAGEGQPPEESETTQNAKRAGWAADYFRGSILDDDNKNRVLALKAFRVVKFKGIL
mmetsp:Transcript_35437/g.31928  ORF Transcript_35437/g.31928 Transcript_35437/m.31928 type:complete len:361 (-) Transcript_35437:672-1754(-)